MKSRCICAQLRSSSRTWATRKGSTKSKRPWAYWEYHALKRSKRKTRPTEHFFIPDTQVKPGVNTDHIEAAANYAVDKRPDVIAIIGDWWDLPSLSSYEKKGSKYFHDKSYAKDIEAGNEAKERFMRPLRRARSYKPRIEFFEGNHEFRATRAAHEEPTLVGTVGRHSFDLEGWNFHKYLEVVEIDKILYSHLFLNPTSLIRGALSGTVDNRLNKIKQSFSQGHQQIRLWGSQFTSGGKEICGLVAGAFYSHEEDYQGPQGNNYWRGAVYKHEVKDGRYDPMMLSLGYLIREWL